MKNQVIAFDVSKGRSAVTIYDEHRRCSYQGTLRHTQSGFEELKEKISDIHLINGNPPDVVFEATGVYSRCLERFLRECGLNYYRLNPLEAKMQTATMRRQKGDLEDAHKLAKSHFKEERTPYFVQEDYYEQMQAYARYYSEINHELVVIKGRAHALLQLTFPEIEELMSKNTFLFFNLVKLFPHPELIKSCSKTILKNRIRSNTEKNLSLNQAEKLAVQLLQLAEDSYPAVSVTDMRCDQVRDYADRMNALTRKKAEIIKNMTALSQERNEFHILKSFPGIADTTACLLIGEIGDFRRFKSAKQLNAFAGIDIQRYQSGDTFYKDRINKRGNSQLRSLLYFMLKGMIMKKATTKNHFVDHYYKLRMQPQSKPHKVALVACMNKFLKVAFHLITHGIPYDYENATTRP